MANAFFSDFIHLVRKASSSSHLLILDSTRSTKSFMILIIFLLLLLNVTLVSSCMPTIPESDPELTTFIPIGSTTEETEMPCQPCRVKIPILIIVNGWLLETINETQFWCAHCLQSILRYCIIFWKSSTTICKYAMHTLHVRIFA